MSIFDDMKAKADANGDGKLSKDDFEALKEKYSGDEGAQEKLQGLKEKVDANGDGKLDFDDARSLFDGGLGGMRDKFNM